MKYALVPIVALLLTPAAAGHITAVPPFGSAGADVRLVLNVINERSTHPMSELTVRVPDGMTVVSAEPLGGWRAEVDERVVRWSGGVLGPNFTADFAVVVAMPRRAGAVELEAVQGYPDGGVTQWPVALTVTPGASSGGMGTTAIALAVVAGLIVFGASALVVRALRHRPLQEE